MESVSVAILAEKYSYIADHKTILKNFKECVNMRIHLWFPALFSDKGGIQRYSLFLLEVFKENFPNSQVTIFLKHDRADTFPSNFFSSLPQNFRVHYAGNCPNYWRTTYFAAQLFGYGSFRRPDLILTSHVNFTPVAHKLKKIFGTPYWAIAHGIDSWNISDVRLKAALVAADRIYSVSNYTSDRLASEQRLDLDKMRILPNTFDSEQFRIRPKPDYLLKRYGLQPEQPVLLTLCRLVKAEAYKGYDQILEALPIINQSFPSVRYILAGKGDDVTRIKSLVRQHRLEKYVILTGFIPDNELEDHYNLCDVFAMPSKGEGFGIVYLEAMACGKPVLGGNQDGAVDALFNGTFGALVNPDDSKEIAQTLISILAGDYGNPLMYKPEALRQAVSEQYGFERFQHNLLCELQEVIS